MINEEPLLAALFLYFFVDSSFKNRYKDNMPAKKKAKKAAKKKATKKKIAKPQVNPNRAKYTRLCNRQTGQLNSDIAGGIERVSKARSKIIPLVDSIQRDSRLLKQVSAQRSDKRFVTMYNSLTSNKKVEKVYCVDTTVVICTKTLFALSHVIGSCEIHIDLMKGELSIKNRERIVVHPLWEEMHIPQMVCKEVHFGSLAEAVNELILKRDLANLVVLIIRFIESGKVDGRACESVQWWPREKESREKYIARAREADCWSIKDVT